MMREIRPFGLRMPPDLKQAVEKAASTNRRSINAEIVLRLQRSLEKEPIVLVEIDEEASTPDYNRLPPPHVKNTQAGYEKTEARLIDLVKRLPAEQQEALLILLRK